MSQWVTFGWEFNSRRSLRNRAASEPMGLRMPPPLVALNLADSRSPLTTSEARVYLDKRLDGVFGGESAKLDCGPAQK